MPCLLDLTVLSAPLTCITHLPGSLLGMDAPCPAHGCFLLEVHACLEAKASAALHAAKQELQDVREHFEAQMRHLDRDHKGEVAGLMQEIGSLRAATAQGIRGQRRGVTERPAASQQRQTQGEMQKAMKDSHACRWNRWQVAAQNTG